MNEDRERVARLKALIDRDYPDSDLSPVLPEGISKLRERYPGFPGHLEVLLTDLGQGCIGDSGYSVWALLDPGDIFDSATAVALGEVVLVGNDFWEHCEAYDTAAGWRFGYIGESRRFRSHVECHDFVEFLLRWCERNK
jgi:hypothetical protein